jgi:hypothetical protein
MSMHRVSFQTLAGRSFDAEIPSTSEVTEMKKLVQKTWNIAPEHQRLVVRDEVLSDFDILECIIEMVQWRMMEPLLITVVTTQKPFPCDKASQLSTLIAKLACSDGRVRRGAVEALRRKVDVTDERELEFFVREVQASALTCSASAAAKRAGLEALAKVSPQGNSSIIRVVHGFLQDTSEFVRLSAAEALAVLVPRGHEATVRMMQRLLKSGRPEIQLVAIMVLGDVDLGGKQVMDVLATYSDSKDEAISTAAADAVSSILRHS